VPASLRETVAAVEQLKAPKHEGVSVSAVAKELRIDKSSASRRIRGALGRGYLRNLEERKGRPFRLVIGDPLPDDIPILPDTDTLAECCGVAAESGG
jgi:hypothetical protein